MARRQGLAMRGQSAEAAHIGCQPRENEAFDESQARALYHHVRGALADLISEEQDLEVCGEAGSVPDALQKMSENPADLAIVGISLEDGSGLELVKTMRQQNPSVPVIVFSMHDERIYAERCIRAGARGYVMKRESTR